MTLFCGGRPIRGSQIALSHRAPFRRPPAPRAPWLRVGKCAGFSCSELRMLRLMLPFSSGVLVVISMLRCRRWQLSPCASGAKTHGGAIDRAACDIRRIPWTALVAHVVNFGDMDMEERLGNFPQPWQLARTPPCSDSHVGLQKDASVPILSYIRDLVVYSREGAASQSAARMASAPETETTRSVSTPT